MDGPADVAIRVFDTLGREVVRGFEGYLAAGRHEIQLDLTSLSAGTYLVELRTDRGQIVRQVVKV